MSVFLVPTLNRKNINIQLNRLSNLTANWDKVTSSRYPKNFFLKQKKKNNRTTEKAFYTYMWDIRCHVQKSRTSNFVRLTFRLFRNGFNRCFLLWFRGSYCSESSSGQVHSCFRLVPSRFSCLCDDRWEGLSEFALHQGKEGRKTGSEACVKLTLILAMTDAPQHQRRPKWLGHLQSKSIQSRIKD